jgi:hypothetical protein
MNCLSLHDSPGAYHSFNKALKLAQEGGMIPSVLDSLVGLATISCREKAGKELLALVLLVLKHPSLSSETYILANQLRLGLESRLTQNEVDGALEVASSKRLDELVSVCLQNEAYSEEVNIGRVDG